MTTKLTAEAEKLSQEKHLTITQAMEVSGRLERFRRALSSENDLFLMLAEKGPFTVFGPQDSAFKQVYDELMRNKEQLIQVLKNHIVRGEYSIEQMKTIDSLTTLDGKTLTVKYMKTPMEHVEIDGAAIILPNIRCSNGMLHEIDKVLMP